MEHDSGRYIQDLLNILNIAECVGVRAVVRGIGHNANERTRGHTNHVECCPAIVRLLKQRF
jgi:hypothetical protein